MADVRTRFNPSPTGYLHIGNLRAALFQWLWARRSGGQFLFRLEDTDRARFVPDAEAQIRASLEWIGLNWDGEVWHQSRRLEIYRKLALGMVESGKAYVADETPDELKAMREIQQKRGDQPHYDGRSRDRGLAWEPDSGKVIRFRWPDDPPPMSVTYFAAGKETGTMLVDPQEAPSAFEDFVMLKADGYPTYNFAHVVDDHAQGITHVIRGNEFTPSLHKFVAVHDALGYQLPDFIHVPPILGPDGKSKLSKRHGAQDVLDYRAAGYLPEALANFLALIGWNPGGDKELFWSLDELADAFTLDGLQKSPGVFDDQKLKWMNKEHMKHLGAGELKKLAVAEDFWKARDSANEDRVFELSIERAQTLKEIDQENEYFFTRPKVAVEQITGDEEKATVRSWLDTTTSRLKDVSEWQSEKLQEALNEIRTELDVKPKELFPILREALTGAPHTPALWDVLEVLGKEESLARLAAAEALVA